MRLWSAHVYKKQMPHQLGKLSSICLCYLSMLVKNVDHDIPTELMVYPLKQNNQTHTEAKSKMQRTAVGVA